MEIIQILLPKNVPIVLHCGEVGRPGGIIIFSWSHLQQENYYGFGIAQTLMLFNKGNQIFQFKIIYIYIFNRPGVAGDVLQTPS